MGSGKLMCVQTRAFWGVSKAHVGGFTGSVSWFSPGEKSIDIHMAVLAMHILVGEITLQPLRERCLDLESMAIDSLVAHGADFASCLKF